MPPKKSKDDIKKDLLNKGFSLCEEFKSLHLHKTKIKCVECNLEQNVFLRNIFRDEKPKCVCKGAKKAKNRIINGKHDQSQAEEFKAKINTITDAICLNPEKYTNNKSNLEWKCKLCDKTWQAPPANILSYKSHCPNCNSGNKESVCRAVLEKLYPEYKFPTVRPEFLRREDSNKCLEIDCYNEKLKFGLEYNGVQHYSVKGGFYGKTEEDLKQQQEKDQWKLNKCAENNVHLVVISYKDFNKKSNLDIKKLIYDKSITYMQSKNIRIDTDYLASADIDIKNYGQRKKINNQADKTKFRNLLKELNYQLAKKEDKCKNFNYKAALICDVRHYFEMHISQFLKEKKCLVCRFLDNTRQRNIDIPENLDIKGITIANKIYQIELLCNECDTRYAKTTSLCYYSDELNCNYCNEKISNVEFSNVEFSNVEFNADEGFSNTREFSDAEFSDTETSGDTETRIMLEKLVIKKLKQK